MKVETIDLKAVNEFDVVDIKIVDLDGEDRKRLLAGPSTCKFDDTFNYTTFNFKKGEFDIFEKQTDKYDLKIIVPGANINVHIWNKSQEIFPNGNDKNHYDVSKNEVKKIYLPENNYEKIRIERFGGEAFQRTIRVQSLYNKEVEIVDAYITDCVGGNVFSLLENPVTIPPYNPSDKTLFLDLNDASYNYYSELNDEAIINIVTKDITYSFCLSDEFENGKNVSDYNLEDNLTIKGDWQSLFPLGFVNINFTFNNKNIIVVRSDESNSSDSWVDIVEAYFTDENSGNKKQLISNPKTVYFHDRSQKIIIENINNFNDYYEACNGKIKFYFMTNVYNIEVRLYNDVTKFEPSGKSIDDYDLTNLSVNSDTEYWDIAKIEISDEKFLSFGIKETTYFSKPDIYVLDIWSEKFYNFDIADMFYTDENSENRYSIIDDPVTFDVVEASSLSGYHYQSTKYETNINIQRPSDTYYETCNNKIKLHIVTTYGVAILNLEGK